MCEAEQTGVQGLTRKRRDPGPDRAAPCDRASGTRAVNRITDQWVSMMGEMHPDLMCSAGGKAAFDECRLKPNERSTR